MITIIYIVIITVIGYGDIDGLMQDPSDCSALAMALLQSCT